MVEIENKNNFYRITDDGFYSDAINKIAAKPEYSMEINCKKYETHNEIIIDKEFLKGPFGPSYISEDTLDILKENFDKQKYVGLAAPQIGIPERVAVIWDKENTEWIDIVDWKIVDKSMPFEIEESCLSLPGKVYLNKRYRQITVQNNNGKQSVWYFGDEDKNSPFYDENIIVIAIQHEIDHLNGILIEDTAIKEMEIKKVEQRTVVKVGRNDPCPCCSGKKYKRCCGK